MYNDSDLTQLLFSWVSGDVICGERLKAVIYNHCHLICKQHIRRKRKNDKTTEAEILEYLNTTSLLHNLLLDLVPPAEYHVNRAEFYDYISRIIRNMGGCYIIAMCISMSSRLFCTINSFLLK